MAKKGKKSGEGKNLVTTGIVGEPESFDRDLKTFKSTVNTKKKELEKMKKKPLNEDETYPAWIISRLPQACSVSYCGETIMIPARCPKGKLRVKNSRMLGKLPNGVQTIAIKN